MIRKDETNQGELGGRWTSPMVLTLLMVFGGRPLTGSLASDLGYY